MKEDEVKIRLKNAIILLANQNTYTVGDITLNSKDNKHLGVKGWTNSISLESITKQNALADLSETKRLFDIMVKCSQEFQQFVKNKQIVYYVCFDYGMGGIEICNETNGHLSWTVEFKK